MSLEKILAISGKPGLYELKTQTRNGFVAESLSDGKKISVSLRHNVSLLSEIAIYTYTEEVPLGAVLEKVKEKESGAATSVNHKDSKTVLADYFSGILPDYDQDRVYPSDIKKVIQWYNLLHSKGMTDFTAEASSEEE